MRPRLPLFVLFAPLGLALAWWQLRPSLKAQTRSTPLAPSARTLVVRFGISDRSGKDWRGRLDPVSGEGRVAALEGYHFQSPDRVSGNAFEFATRPWLPVFREVDLSPGRPGPRPVFPNGIYARVSGGNNARFRLQAGDLSEVFALADLEAGKTLSLAGGNIEIDLVPAETALSGPEAEADYPSLAFGPAGRMAVAFQEFAKDHDRLVAGEMENGSFRSETWELPETRDVFRSAVAYDGSGQLHVVWSAQVDNNWDLYERRRTPQGWTTAQRLTAAPETDFQPKLAATPSGDLWLAWQGFRNGQSDIFARQFTGGAWGPELRISESPANDWEPALAAAPDGTVWVGWDTYDRGNYDVCVRPIRNGAPGPLRRMTNSGRFEAHVSLAADARNRLWLAFDEAETNWGKDFGYLFMDRGNPLYQTRRIRVLRLAGEQIEEPEAPVAGAFPLALPDYLQEPQVAALPDGRVAVVALQLTHCDRVIGVWGARGVWENVLFTLGPAGWTRDRVLPSSRGANDIRAAAAVAADGTLWAAWASDGRPFGSGQPGRQSVYLAAAPASPSQGEIRTRPYTEAQDLAFPVHPVEPANIRAVRDYRIRLGDKQYRILRGDLHRHTSLSADGIGDGSLWDFYRYVLDAADMDYSTVTDHQGGGTAYNWWKTQKSTDLFLLPGRLTSIYAYERSVLYPNGHRNIVFPKRGAPILPISPEEQRGQMRSADVVLPYLRQYNAIDFRHTTATGQGTDWQDHNNELEPMVEVYQGHRVVYEHEGGPKGATADKAYLQRSGYRPAGFIWNALAKGYRFGFEASSDHCSTHVSYACILAEDTTRDAIIAAMRQRHSYGAMDNIVVDFRVKANGREYLQGDELETSGRFTLTLNAMGTRPIRRVDVIHNETYIYALTPTGKSTVSFAYNHAHPVSGENRYYIRIEQEDGSLAWSSPVWIRYR